MSKQNNKAKQLKLRNFFGKSGRPIILNECAEIEQRIEALNEKLRAKQTQLFDIQRNSYKQPIAARQRKSDDEVFSPPGNIMLSNSVEVVKGKLELLTMLTGLEVQSFLRNDHCCIVFHMQHDSPNIIKHGLRIEMNSYGNELTKSSLPIGFRLNAIVDNYDNILKPEILLSIHKALIAYYDRLKQYEELEKLLSINGTLFRALDSSHIEVTFHSNIDENNQDIKITIIFDYRVHDIRPKTYIIQADIPDYEIEKLLSQCMLFRKKSLRSAFKSMFMDDGDWQLVDQLGIEKEYVQAKTFRPNKNPNIDNTFRPEECSDQGDEEFTE